jgi:hypothetical protein
MWHKNVAFKLMDKALKSTNQKIRVGEIVCDLMRAFDCIDHDILLTKLHFCGIQRQLQNG